MFYTLFYYFGGTYSFLNVLKYISFRSFGALATSFLIGLLCGPHVIVFLKQRQSGGQPIRLDGPEGHLLTKKGTPTMGGVLILLSIIGSALLWCDLQNMFVWIVLFILISYGMIGAMDDYQKVLKKNSKGISARLKFFLQLIFALIGTFLVISYTSPENATVLNLPFFKTWIIDLGTFYMLFGVFVVVGASNAVNLTDGLDGLAIVPVMIASICLGLIAYLTGHVAFAKYLYIPSIPGTGELTILCASMVGAGLGFLWYNAPPAQVFMGDVGSLSIGGALGMMSVITKHEMVFAVIGGVFVLETISVMIQVAYFKITKGKRIFLMTPIHHHFEKKVGVSLQLLFVFGLSLLFSQLLGLQLLN